VPLAASQYRAIRGTPPRRRGGTSLRGSVDSPRRHQTAPMARRDPRTVAQEMHRTDFSRRPHWHLPSAPEPRPGRTERRRNPAATRLSRGRWRSPQGQPFPRTKRQRVNLSAAMRRSAQPGKHPPTESPTAARSGSCYARQFGKDGPNGDARAFPKLEETT
jgi:hypothetical protein